MRKIKSLILNSSLSFYARSGPLQLGVVLVLFDIISGLICTYEQKVFVIFKAARLQYFESASRPSAA